MENTIQMLIAGDTNICEYYRLAGERWKEIWNNPDSGSPNGLAALLAKNQSWFEVNCGTREDRMIGQEIMAAVGFGMLHSTKSGFSKNEKQAMRLLAAFEKSNCSIELKGYARDIAACLGLVEGEE